MRSLSICIAALFIFHVSIASNYSIFYNYLSLYARINVTSSQFNDVDTLTFNVSYSSTPHPLVLVNNITCMPNCSVPLLASDTTALMFDDDDSSVIGFYNYDSTATLLLYNSCYEPMDGVRCRCKISSKFVLCICNGSVPECAYDAPLEVDKSWCLSVTPNTESTTSKPSNDMVTTTTTSRRASANFTLIYHINSGLPGHNEPITVNITTSVIGSNVLSATFDVSRPGPQFYDFRVNGKRCMRTCTEDAINYDFIFLGTTFHHSDVVAITVTESLQALFIFDDCDQPMEEVKCREHTFESWSLCLCNGHGKECNGQVPFLLRENNCLPKSISTPATELTKPSALTFSTSPSAFTESKNFTLTFNFYNVSTAPPSSVMVILITTTTYSFMEHLVAHFSVLSESAMGHQFFLGKRRCPYRCGTLIKFGEGNATVNADNDVSNELILHIDQYGELKFTYDSCDQPMTDVSCRTGRINLTGVHLCQGIDRICGPVATFALQQYNCLPQSLSTTRNTSVVTSTIATPTTELITPSAPSSSSSSSKPSAVTKSKNFTLTYNFYKTQSAMTILITTTPYEFVQQLVAAFVVLNETTTEHRLFVHNRICRITCTAAITYGRSSISLRVDGYFSNELILHSDRRGEPKFIYDSCDQPMNNVRCRARQTSVTGVHLCSGVGGPCLEADPFLLGKNHCSLPRTMSSTSLMITTGAATTATTTKMTTLSSFSASTKTNSVAPSQRSTASLTSSTAITPQPVSLNTISSLHPTTSTSAPPTHINVTVAPEPITTQMATESSVSLQRSTVPLISSTTTTPLPLPLNTTIYSFRPTTSTSAPPPHITVTAAPKTTSVNSSTVFFSSSASLKTTVKRETTMPAKPSMETKATVGKSTPKQVSTTTFGGDTLKDLSEGGVGPNNVTTILNETLTYSKPGSDLTSTQIQQITTILNNSAAIENLPIEDAQAILLIVDSILSANQEQIDGSRNSSRTLLSLLPALVHNTNASQFEFLHGKNIGFFARRVDCSVTIDNGLADFGTTFKVFRQHLAENDQHNSICIPVADICKVQQATHFFLTIFRNRKLFNGRRQYRSYSSASSLVERSKISNYVAVQLNAAAKPGDLAAENVIPPPPQCSRQTALPVDSPVMTGTVFYNDQAVSRLDVDTTMAVLRFSVTNILAPLHGHFRATWWDTEKLEWSSEEQCGTTTDGDMVVAHCSHLTDFTLIVDASLDDPNVCDPILINLGCCLNALSTLSLVFLLFMSLSSYWPACLTNNVLDYLRGYAAPRKDFVCLTHRFISLLFYVVFAAFSDQKFSGSACEFFGAVAYSLLMSSVLLTIFQALRLPPVLGSMHSRYRVILLPSSSVTISLLFPSTVSTLLLILTKFFERGDCFCWVRPDYVIYAVIIPISSLLLNTAVCTVIVCYRMFAVHRKFSKSMRHRDHNMGAKLVAVLVMQISLGMPWILQYPTLYSPNTTVWHYVFTVVMGSQGAVLALLFLYKRQRSMSIYRQSRLSQQSIISNDSEETKDKD